MAGSSLDHSAIGLNMGRLLQDALEERPCWVYNSDYDAHPYPPHRRVTGAG